MIVVVSIKCTEVFYRQQGGFECLKRMERLRISPIRHVPG